ncbi:MAG TPA: hypothetical protein VN788_00075 [Verrucomicrobiae bacterium]|nr:hypothetical protein [Verrucomicrobiae bacterium]
MSNVLDSVLGNLSKANTIVTLGVEVAGEIVPLIKGTVKKIEQLSTGENTVTYSVLVQTDVQALADVESLSEADLEAINGELARLGKPPLPGPPARQPNPPSAT